MKAKFFISYNVYDTHKWIEYTAWEILELEYDQITISNIRSILSNELEKTNYELRGIKNIEKITNKY